MYEEPLSGYHSSVEVQSRLLRHDSVSLHGKFSMWSKTLFSDYITFDNEDTILHTYIQDVPGVRVTTKLKINSVALVRTRTIPTERPPPVGEVSANFCG